MIDNRHQILNFLTEYIPSSNTFYKNLEGRVTKHKYNVPNNLIDKSPFKNMVGKTVFDVFSKECAEQCREKEIQILKNKNTITETVNIEMLSGEISQRLVIGGPYFNKNKEISGIIVHCFELNKFNKYISNSLDTYYSAKINPLKNTYSKLKQFNILLSEILILINLIEVSEQNQQKILCLELKNFTKTTIKHYNNILLQLHQLD